MKALLIGLGVMAYIGAGVLLTTVFIYFYAKWAIRAQRWSREIALSELMWWYPIGISLWPVAFPVWMLLSWQSHGHVARGRANRGLGQMVRTAIERRLTDKGNAA